MCRESDCAQGERREKQEEGRGGRQKGTFTLFLLIQPTDASVTERTRVMRAIDNEYERLMIERDS